MFANALRGLGWAGLSAAGYSLLALSAPAERRGEASGYYSGIQASGTILLPAVALWLIYAPFGGFRTVFVVAIALAAIGAGTGALVSHAQKEEIKADVDDTLPPNSSGIVALFEEQWASEIEKALPKASKVTKEQVDADSATEVDASALLVYRAAVTATTPVPQATSRTRCPSRP